MPDFIPGLQLADGFYHEAVKPVIEADFPQLEYGAALIGSGSEVLGFDTEMSTDHHWGPRVMLFFRDDVEQSILDTLHETLRQRLPYTFRGYSTHFGAPSFEEGDHGTQLLETIDSGLVNHRVEMFRLRDFFRSYLNFDIADDITPFDWLTFPQQHLRAITGGAVYHDGVGLQAVRDRFAHFPDDVWVYLLAAGWARIGQEEHLCPRAGYVGDELGAAIMGSRLVRDMMMLGFLMARVYAPYPKWYGTAFQQLECAAELTPLFWQIQRAETWQEREIPLCAAYETLARMHNALHLTEPLPATVSQFHGRPFNVIEGGRFTSALVDCIQDPALRQFAKQHHFGSIDQFSDSTDLREAVSLRLAVRGLYGVNRQRD